MPANDLHPEQRQPNVRSDLLVIIGVTWFVVVLLVLYALAHQDPNRGLSFRLGQAAMAGFWLACGRPRWSIRLVVVIVAVLALGTWEPYGSIEGVTLVAVAMIMVTGWTYLARILFAVITREASPHQRFSILGVMLATTVVAGMIVALRYGIQDNWMPTSDTRIMVILFHLATLGSAYVLQCAVWWARTRRLFWSMVAAAIFMVIAAPLFAYPVHLAVTGDTPPIDGLLELHWIAEAAIWLELGVVQWVLLRLGTSLIDESWMQRKGEPSEGEPSEPEPADAESSGRDVGSLFLAWWYGPPMNHAEPSDASTPNDPPTPQWTAIAISYFAWVVLEALIVALVVPDTRDYSMAFRFGLIAAVAFWLGCGRAPWWLRLVAVLVVIGGLSFQQPGAFGIDVLIFAAVTLIFTGIVFALRAALSLIDRRSNRHHSISIKGIMVAMVGSACLFLILSILVGDAAPMEVVDQLSVMAVQFSCVGLAFHLQCAAVWLSGARFYWWWLVSVAVAAVIMLGAFTFNLVTMGDGRIGEWLQIYGIGSFSIWLAVYPLDTLLRRFGWSLVQPSWYLPEWQAWAETTSEPPPESPPEPHARRYPLRDSAVESVDFDDIV